MNFLGHLLLSGDDEEIILGNFIGDSVKGREYKKYPEGVQTGLLLHRAIDSFTDNHEIVKSGKSKFRELYGKHSGILTDIFYDHFLSINWNSFSNLPKSEFIRNSYILLLKNYRIMPGEVKLYLPFMIVNNWLAKYEHIDGITQVLRGMSLRTSLPDLTDSCMHIFKNYYNELNSEFNSFFPEIIEHVKIRKEEIIANYRDAI